MAKDEKSPEAIAIIAKLKKKRGASADDGADDEGAPDEEGDESDGDAGEEAKSAAAEDLFRAIRGRDPNEEERAAVREALESFHDACGGY